MTVAASRASRAWGYASAVAAVATATAIGGLMPLAVQNIGLYSPMAWVIIGGLITSTLLARLVTPVMYKLAPPAVPGSVAV